MRMTEQASDTLSRSSKKARLSKADYIQRLIMETPIVEIVGLEKFMPELKLSSRNLNQVAARLSMGQNIYPDVSDTKRLYREILVELRTMQKGGFVTGNHQDAAA